MSALQGVHGVSVLICVLMSLIIVMLISMRMRSVMKYTNVFILPMTSVSEKNQRLKQLTARVQLSVAKSMRLSAFVLLAVLAIALVGAFAQTNDKELSAGGLKVKVLGRSGKIRLAAAGYGVVPDESLHT